MEHGGGGRSGRAGRAPASPAPTPSRGGGTDEYALLGLHWKERRWVPPSLTEAIAQGRAAVFGSRLLPLWTTPIRELMDLGPGVSLHFRIVRSLALCFTGLSILAAPMFAIMSSGASLQASNMDLLKMAALSIANVAVSHETTSLGASVTVSPHPHDPATGTLSSASWYDVAERGGVNATVTLWPHTPFHHVTARAISAFIALYDIIIVLAFIGFSWLLAYSLHRHDRQLDASTITPTDYTVVVHGLPPDTTEDEVRLFFNSRYNLYTPDWTYPSAWWRCYMGRKMAARHQFRPTTTAHTGNVSMPAHAGVAAALHAASHAGRGAVAGGDTGLTLLPAIHSVDADHADVYPVMNARNTGDARFLYGWVADVILARRNGWLIKRYQDKMSLLRRILDARATVLRLAQHKGVAVSGRGAGDNGSGASVGELKAALKRLGQLESRLQQVHQRHGEHYSNQVSAAFVTFQHEISFKRCLQDYEGSEARWWSPACARCCPPPPTLLFRGRHPLHIKRAPAPTSIVWQNLELSPGQRCCRSVGVNLITLLVLLLSLGVSVLVQGQANVLRGTVPSPHMCDAVLPAIAFNATVRMDGSTDGHGVPPAWVTHISSPDTACPASAAPSPGGLGGGATVSLRVFMAAPPALPVTAPNASDPCRNECMGQGSVCTLPVAPTPPYTLPGAMSFPTDVFLQCACQHVLTRELSTRNLVDASTTMAGYASGVCGTALSAAASYNAFILGGSAAVVVVNMVLRSLLAAITHWDGHDSLEELHMAIAWKVFVSLFLNTAAIALIIFAALPAPVSSLRVGTLTLLDGTFASYSAAWHVLVGAGNIVLTMLINVISPHVQTVGYLAMAALDMCRSPGRGIVEYQQPPTLCCRARHVSTFATQAALNEAFNPPEFEVPTRVALLLFTTVTCFMFAPGHPILLPIAALSFGLTYAFDKAALLRVTRRPPIYSSAMAGMVLRLLPWAVILHLATAIWMYSDPTVLYSPTAFTKAPIGGDSGTGWARAASDWLVAAFHTAAGADRSGLFFIRRISRENTVPLFLLFFIYTTAHVLWNPVAKAGYRAGAMVVACVTGGRCCTAARGREDTTGLMCNPPFTGPYALLVDTSHPYDLTAREVMDGWRLVTDGFGRTFRVLTCTSDCTLFGARHRRGDLLATWEVMALQGQVVSYDVLANPVYGPAVAVMEVGRRQAAAAAAAGGAGADARSKAVTLGGAVRATHVQAQAAVVGATQGRLRPGVHLEASPATPGEAESENVRGPHHRRDYSAVADVTSNPLARPPQLLRIPKLMSMVMQPSEVSALGFDASIHALSMAAVLGGQVDRMGSLVAEGVDGGEVVLGLDPLSAMLGAWQGGSADAAADSPPPTPPFTPTAHPGHGGGGGKRQQRGRRHGQGQSATAGAPASSRGHGKHGEGGAEASASPAPDTDMGLDGEGDIAPLPDTLVLDVVDEGRLAQANTAAACAVAAAGAGTTTSVSGGVGAGVGNVGGLVDRRFGAKWSGWVDGGMAKSSPGNPHPGTDVELAHGAGWMPPPPAAESGGSPSATARKVGRSGLGSSGSGDPTPSTPHAARTMTASQCATGSSSTSSTLSVARGGPAHERGVAPLVAVVQQDGHGHMLRGEAGVPGVLLPVRELTRPTSWFTTTAGVPPPHAGRHAPAHGISVRGVSAAAGGMMPTAPSTRPAATSSAVAPAVISWDDIDNARFH